MNSNSIRIIIVDDHHLFRSGVRNALSYSREGALVEVVSEVACGVDFFKELQKGVCADVVLLDIKLPDLSGVEISRRLKSEYPDLKILILSAESDKEVISELVELGINGFISKNVSTIELLNAIDCVSKGHEYFGKDIASILRDINIIKRNLCNFKFTARELQILELSAKGMLAKEIAQELEMSAKTVDVHKYNIFKKLGIKNSIELVRYALKNGIINL